MAKKTSPVIIANGNIWVSMCVLGYPVNGALVAMVDGYSFIAPDDETGVFIKVTDAIKMNANDLSYARSAAEKKFRAVNAELLNSLLRDYCAGVHEHQISDEWVVAYYYYLKNNGQPKKLLNKIRMARPHLFVSA